MTCATVPGRVNLIGEWIDFNGGTVLPMALSQSVELEMCANGQTHDRVQSQQFSDITDFGIDVPAAGHWSDYVRGGLQYGRRMGWITGGQDVILKSTIPVGAGLSSSAATIVATLRAAGAELAGIDPAGIARAAQDVENIFMGVPCGIMDQMAVSVGRPGNVLALDTRDCSYQIMPVPAGWTFAVIHSGIARALSDGRYRARRQECLEAAGSLGVPYLCDGKLEDTPSLPPVLARRARHVISEGARSLQAVTALAAASRPSFGMLMNASHASLRDDMDVSVPALDAMVDDAVELGADGARITGAGFGGCFVCLVETGQASAWWSRLKARHPGAVRVV
ncbi:galactokinase family protein [Hyphomonas sp.]|uniref:galactokinase n=1 Tax=Hyphomonas sp. TaxID=87 RepID=UPI001BCF0899|nr:galactokinase family protein [Hyphomonas sp.]